MLCTGIPILFAIAPAVPQKNPTLAKSTASPLADDLSQVQRRPIPVDWKPIPVIPSLKDNAFNVVRDYVHIFPLWEDYSEDKHHFHIFLSNLHVSAIIHGYYFPAFLLIEHINDLHYIVVTRRGSIWIVFAR